MLTIDAKSGLRVLKLCQLNRITALFGGLRTLVKLAHHNRLYQE
jgi:hypothetical protein